MLTKTLGDFEDSPTDETDESDDDCLCDLAPEGPGCFAHYEA
jgi:hypothetical protein